MGTLWVISQTCLSQSKKHETFMHQLPSGSLIVNTYRTLTSYQFQAVSVCGDHLSWVYKDPSTPAKQRYTILDSLHWMRDASNCPACMY